MAWWSVVGAVRGALGSIGVAAALAFALCLGWDAAATSSRTGSGDRHPVARLETDTSSAVREKSGSSPVQVSRGTAPCLEIETHEILCQADGSFQWLITLTNLSGQTATLLFFGDPAITPTVVPLSPPLLNGQSTLLQFTITGPPPSSHFCFPVILANVEGEECCHIEHCLDLPDCECAQISSVALVPTATPGVFNLTFTFTNLSAWSTGHLVFLVNPGTISPALVNIPSTPPFGSQSIGPLSVTTAALPGTPICFTIGNHSVNWAQCCFVEVCTVVPSNPVLCPPGDLNGDGIVDAADLAILLGNWGFPGIGDLNGDGVVDAKDLGILLGMWGQTC
ncbi:MAG: hypothetical protein SGJ09_16850 [Phycisphaerae bacterium]|nr:hypothetical protein [Phycisphaerae bacterium]